MSRWRVAVLLALFLAPFLFLMAMGSYHLWERGWTFMAWWPMALCITASTLLAWYWQRRKQLLPKMDFSQIPHGSERDQEAWKLVAERATAAEALPPERYGEPSFYLESGQALALELAKFYHPEAKDPYGNLTVLEILAVAELAARDLAEMVEKYVPGSHLLTINDWRSARRAVDWYRRANNVYWLVSAVFAPIETAVRFAASKVAHGSTWDMLQQNLLLWFYTAYLHRLGTYLIELHSGRLRVGVKRYREMLGTYAGTDAPVTTGNVEAPPAIPAREVTLTAFGQVKVGKSSLINALLGERRAITDVLPTTNEVTRYRLKPANIDSELVILDTVGYGNEGPTDDQLKNTEEAARQSDVLLLVLHARNPARQADLLLLDRLRAWFAAHPDLRMPPIVAVVTHIDLLSPALEWAPPYDWQTPQRPKEIQIHEALKAVRTQLGERVTAVVPVCVAEGRVFGIQESLLPVLSEKLGEARGVALLRCLRAEADAGKIRKLFDQLYQAGKKAALVVWEQTGKQ